MVPVGKHVCGNSQLRSSLDNNTLIEHKNTCHTPQRRLNQVSVLIQRTGAYYGEFRGLCGAQHGMTPIKLECIPLSVLVEWGVQNG